MGQEFSSFSHYLMHYSWYKCLHLRTTAVYPENSVQHIGQLNKHLNTYSNQTHFSFWAIVKTIILIYLLRPFLYFLQVITVAKLLNNYFIAHIVCVRLIKIHNFDIMSDHKLLHILVHKPAHLQKVLRLVAMINELLISSTMTHKSFHIPLIAL